MFLSSPPTGKRIVSLMQACDIIGVSRRTLYNWIQDNKVDWVRTASGSIRIVEDTLFNHNDTSKIKERINDQTQKES